MQDDVKHTNDRDGTAVSLRVAACLAIALIAAGVLVAGCGGTSPSGGVAIIGTHASKTSTTSSTAAGSTGGGESSPGSQAVAYAACMRSHGVANFPEPQVSEHGNEGSVKMAVPVGVGSNPKFKPAQQACRKLLPGGGPNNQPALTSAQQNQYLKAAECIRSHGIPNFPDPTFSGGDVHIEHQGLNESSPAFKAAVHACESLIPGGAHGGSGSTSEEGP